MKLTDKRTYTVSNVPGEFKLVGLYEDRYAIKRGKEICVESNELFTGTFTEVYQWGFDHGYLKNNRPS